MLKKRDEINDIRLKIYKNTKLYDYYANKKELNKKQQKRFNEIINNLNELHEYLLNKANNEDNANYELDKLFDDNIYYKPIQTKRAFYENYTLYESNGDNISSLYEYFAKIKPYLSTLIDFYKEQGEYKAQPSMQIKFISVVDNTESQIMHSKSDNVEIMSGYDTDNVINMLIDTFTKRYQQGLETTKMKGSSYVFDRIVAMFLIVLSS